VNDLLEVGLLLDYLLELGLFDVDLLHGLLALLDDGLPLFGEALFDLLVEFVCFLGLFDEGVAVVDLV
jgi:hypothetical protein